MKNKIISIIFLCIIVAVGIYSIILKDTIISNNERRKLAQFPEFNKDFIENLDKYLLDQFPFREQLITLNSFINTRILNKIDNNDVYVIDNNIYDKMYPANEKNYINFTKKVNYIVDNYCGNNQVYYSIIPDKSYFLEEGKYLKIDYNNMFDTINENIQCNYIDITDKLAIDDYYRTDIHWKQEKLFKVVEKIVTSMGKEYKNENYIQNQYKDFYGASYSKAAINIEPDVLIYLENENFKNIEVKHFEHGEKQIYDTEKLKGVDSYDVFLSGPSSFIEIENKNISDKSKLIVFRDSFGSSIVPLLTSYYNKIIIIDLRYMDFNFAKDMLDFEDADVLFLYSTLIINNSNLLKVGIK